MTADEIISELEELMETPFASLSVDELDEMSERLDEISEFMEALDEDELEDVESVFEDVKELLGEEYDLRNIDCDYDGY